MIFEYTVVQINGEYAVLKDNDSGNEVLIAMALLPPGTDLRTRLHFENFEYTILE